MSRATALASAESTCRRLLDAAGPALARSGPGKLTLTNIAALLVVRLASSHFLMPGDDARLLRMRRHLAGTHG